MQLGGRWASVASCGPGYSKLRGVVGHHRLQVVVRGRLDDEALARVVSQRLQARSVVLPVAVVREVLEMYAKVIVALDVLEINEIG